MESKVVKIHPFDLSEILNRPENSILDLYKHNGLIEIDGVFYEQSIDVPAKTTGVV